MANFPEDQGLQAGNQEKTAEEQKTAAYEEKLGARAFEMFADRFDVRMSKIAETVSGDAHITTTTDAEPNQAIANNRAPTGMVGTDGKVTNIVTPQKGKEVAGEEKAQVLPEGTVKAASDQAMRKVWLLSQLETE